MTKIRGRWHQIRELEWVFRSEDAGSPALGRVWLGASKLWIAGDGARVQQFKNLIPAMTFLENANDWVCLMCVPLSGTTAPAPATGIKHDATKARWDLVPWESMIPVVSVLTSGAQKYAPDNWRKVPDARSRYFAAALRHMTAWWGGEINDPETGQHHLAHATCCLLFLISLEGK